MAKPLVFSNDLKDAAMLVDPLTGTESDEPGDPSAAPDAETLVAALRDARASRARHGDADLDTALARDGDQLAQLWTRIDILCDPSLLPEGYDPLQMDSPTDVSRARAVCYHAYVHLVGAWEDTLRQVGLDFVPSPDIVGYSVFPWPEDGPWGEVLDTLLQPVAARAFYGFLAEMTDQTTSLADLTEHQGTHLCEWGDELHGLHRGGEHRQLLDGMRSLALAQNATAPAAGALRATSDTGQWETQLRAAVATVRTWIAHQYQILAEVENVVAEEIATLLDAIDPVEFAEVAMAAEMAQADRETRSRSFWRRVWRNKSREPFRVILSCDTQDIEECITRHELLVTPSAFRFRRAALDESTAREVSDDGKPILRNEILGVIPVTGRVQALRTLRESMTHYLSLLRLGEGS